MNGEETKLVLSRLEDIHTDVRYLRERTDSQQEDITEVKVDIQALKTRNQIIKWVAGIILPLLLAGSVAVAQHILQ
jgi:hypothetical protein